MNQHSHRSELTSKLVMLTVERAKELNCKMSEAFADPTVEMQIVKNQMKEINDTCCFVVLTRGEIDTILNSMKREMYLSKSKDDSWAYLVEQTAMKKLQGALG